MPKTAQGGPHGPKKGPRWPQENRKTAPGWPHDNPKMAPRGLQVASYSNLTLTYLRLSHKTPPRFSRGPAQDPPKIPQAPKRP